MICIIITFQAFRSNPPRPSSPILTMASDPNRSAMPLASILPSEDSRLNSRAQGQGHSKRRAASQSSASEAEADTSVASEADRRQLRQEYRDLLDNVLVQDEEADQKTKDEVIKTAMDKVSHS